MNIDNVTFGQLKEIQKLFNFEKSQSNETGSLGKHICVLQRGWVFVGDLYKTGCEYTLQNAFNVRVWGTTAGLGELAEKGPLSGTKLDSAPETRFHELTVVLFIKCSEEAWK